MKRILVPCVMSFLCCMLVHGRSLGALECALVPHADMVYVVDSRKISSSVFGQAAKAKSAMWNKAMQGDVSMAPEILAFQEKLSLLAQKYGLTGQTFSHFLFSCSLHGTSEEIVSKQGMDLVIAADLSAELKGDWLQDLVALLWQELDLKDLGLEYRLSHQDGKGFRSGVIELSSRDQLMQKHLSSLGTRWCVLHVPSQLLLIGPEASVRKAFIRYQAKKHSVLDPYLANNLGGDIAFAMRLLPVMRKALQGLTDPSFSSLAAMSRGAGLSFKATVSDKMMLELSYECEKPADAVAFQQQIWNVQGAVLVGMVGGMLKAQSNGAITCFDSLTCVAEGRAIRIRMPLTIADIDGFAMYVEQQRKAQEAAARAQQTVPVKKRPAPAQKRPAPAQK